VVLVDLVKHEPCRVPDSWREKIREIEGDDLEA
jgi:acyl-CoA thioesterase FadM